MSDSKEMAQVDESTANEQEHEGETWHKLHYMNLPYYLKNCLSYCCIFPESYWIRKGKLIRLLVAEGLVQENGEDVPEALAEENIEKLVSQGMLQVDRGYGSGTHLFVPSPYHELCLQKTAEGQHSIITIWNSPEHSSTPHTTRDIFVGSDITKIMAHMDGFKPRSLFLLGNQEIPDQEGDWFNFSDATSLHVLDVENTKIKRLPDEVGELMHLTYLCLKKTDIRELPEGIGNLQALETLDIRWCGYLQTLPPAILSLLKLRHLKMFKNHGVCGMKVPEGIGRLRDLLTLTGIYAGGGIAEELGQLINLRRLGVMDVAEDHINELLASVMKMQGLLSLSLEAKHGTFASKSTKLVLSQSFMPPPLIRKLRLVGSLENVPDWLESMIWIRKLRLSASNLSENPMLVLEKLPNLESLTLWHAYDAKQIGKEFCRAGGFPKLEELTIASRVLEEWTEVEEGALPSLSSLHIRNCLRLRMLPEGLQFVTTLKELNLMPLLDDHAERLKPDGGEENYKINNIPRVSVFTMSMLQQRMPQISG